ncbi:hypothetical protein BKA93DRAFT_722793 [Sparassis latifolia]
MVWRPRRCTALLCEILLLLISCSANAQNISTNTQVPPLQWINITGHLTGSAAPPLKDASIGYDEDTRSVVIFGGESQQGFPQSETYILNLDTLVWSQPTGGSTSPPARTLAVSGDDFAASYRRGHVVIGGLDTNGNPLSDVWEYNYAYQYWTNVSMSPGGPSARYGAVGGIDVRTFPATDPTLSTPNNTIYLAGGIDTSGVSSLSDVWRLNISGTLSPNVPNGVVGSWEQVSISSSNVPTKVGAAGAVVSQLAEDIIAVGGCTTSVASSSPCSEGDSYIINTQTSNVQAPSSCPAPRLDGTVVANLNGNSSSFTSQVFLLLGTVNSSQWQDDGGLQKGEVPFSGAWARILPAGDPGSTGQQAFPSPREGAAAISYTQTLVGTQRNIGSDTMVFGGRDASGNYLAEVWILRAYNGSISHTNQTWSGYSGGSLQTGIGADGSGVTVQFMTQCASSVSGQSTQSGSPTPTTPNTPTMSGSPSATSHTSPSSTSTYNTSVVHKALSAISVVLCFPAVILLRLSLPSVNSSQSITRRTALFYLSITVGVAAYGLGIAGMATSFSSITVVTHMTLARRSSSSSAVLKTAHGRAGLAFFVGFYGLVPLLFGISAYYKHIVRKTEITGKDHEVERLRVNSSETGEKPEPGNGRVGSPDQSMNGRPDGSDPRPRVRSWSGWPGFSARRSSDSGFDSTGAPPPPKRSFEVVNRPARVRRASANSLAAFSDPRMGTTPRNLSDMSWFDGRRNANDVGELDVALGHLNRRVHDPPTPGTTAMEMRSTSGLMSPTAYATALPEMPQPVDCILRVLFHAFLLGLTIISLVALWFHAPKATFIVFLVVTVMFYITLLLLAFHGRPKESILTVVVHRLFTTHLPAGPSAAIPHRLSTDGSEAIPFPTDVRGPYQHHHPPFRTTMSGLDEYPTSVSHEHGTAEYEDDDNEEDEDARQRRIEEEMSRRDVSIVTVPKRKLFLTNPEQR